MLTLREVGIDFVLFLFLASFALPFYLQGMESRSKQAAELGFEPRMCLTQKTPWFVIVLYCLWANSVHAQKFLVAFQDSENERQSPECTLHPL